MRALRLLILLFIAAPMVVAIAYGQEAPTPRPYFGKVADADTGIPLNGVQVFYSGTTIGDVTDQAGLYELPDPPIARIIVVFSMLGYEMLSIPLDTRTRQAGALNISLKPSVIGLDGITVSADRDKVWKQNLKRFEKVLFSDTNFGKKCKIINSKSIVLNYDKKTDILDARAVEPLVIENSKLGYRITLHDFSLGSQAGLYHWEGAPQFEELDSNGGKKEKGWRKNRRKAYDGSARHLVKSFIDDVLQDEGFIVYNVFEAGEISVEDLVMELAPTNTDTLKALRPTLTPTGIDDLYVFKPTGALYIQYVKEPASREFRESVQARPYYRGGGARVGYGYFSQPQTSWIDMNVESVFVDYNGNFLVEGVGFPITTYGYMAWERVGELLPFDYIPESDD